MTALPQRMLCALRFLCKVTLKHPWSFHDVIPAPKRPRSFRRCSALTTWSTLSRCVTRPAPRTTLTTCYAAGLRISKAVHLRPTDLDSE